MSEIDRQTADEGQQLESGSLVKSDEPTEEPDIEKGNPKAYDEEEIAAKLSARLSLLSPEVLEAVPKGYCIIPGTPAHIDDCLRLSRALAKYYNDFSSPETKNELLSYFTAPERLHADHIVLIEESTNTVVCYSRTTLTPSTGEAMTYFRGDPFHPLFYELSEAVNKVLEGLVLQKQETVPDERPLTVRRNMLSSDTKFVNSHLLNGYQLAYRWQEMTINLADDETVIPEPSFPEGIEIRPYIREQHAELLYHADEEAFQDHAGYVEPEPYAEWDYWMHQAATYTPDYIFLVWDGNEIAAGVLAIPEEDENGQNLENNEQHNEKHRQMKTISIDKVFCRRKWRRQGIATNLLRYAFRKFRDDDFVRTFLFVDGASKTKAHSVYRAAGMSVRKEIHAYEKYLRGAPVDK